MEREEICTTHARHLKISIWNCNIVKIYIIEVPILYSTATFGVPLGTTCYLFYGVCIGERVSNISFFIGEELSFQSQ